MITSIGNLIKNENVYKRKINESKMVGKYLVKFCENKYSSLFFNDKRSIRLKKNTSRITFAMFNHHEK